MKFGRVLGVVLLLTEVNLKLRFSGEVRLSIDALDPQALTIQGIANLPLILRHHDRTASRTAGARKGVAMEHTSRTTSLLRPPSSFLFMKPR
jgi:hypothetical protein